MPVRAEVSKPSLVGEQNLWCSHKLHCHFACAFDALAARLDLGESATPVSPTGSRMHDSNSHLPDVTAPLGSIGEDRCAVRLNRRLVFAWILVTAMSPTLSALGWTALNMLAFDGLPNSLREPLLVFGLGASALLASWLLQACVLRKVAPALRWSQIVPAMVVAYALGVATEIIDPNLRQVSIGFRLLTTGLPLVELRWDEFASLPWAPLLGQAGALATVCMLLPSWAFARATSLRLWMPLLAAVGASIVVALLSSLWVLAGVHVELLDRSDMTGWSWDKRASALLCQTSAQAIWAATALLILARLTRVMHNAMRASQQLVLGAAVLVGAVVTPVAVDTLSANGVERLTIAARDAFSSAPGPDVSKGEPLLQYAFSAKVAVRKVPWKASASPNGRWIVAVGTDRQVVVFDAATGELSHRFPDVLDRYESPDWAWSPDSQWLVLRVAGERLAAEMAASHRVRVLLYAVPDFAQAGEYRHIGGQCLFEASVESAVLFERSGSAVWVACGTHFRPKPADLLAIRLDVPNLQVQSERRFGEEAPWGLRGLKELKGSIWAWHTDQQPPHARFRDLTNDRVPVVLRRPSEEGPFPQPDWIVQDVSVDEEKAVVRLHAWHAGLRRLLVHDMRTGAMVSLTDGQLPPNDVMRSSISAPDGMRIESIGRRASREGELVVIDTATGRERQRIRTVAQNLLSVSADGRLLVTQSGRELRVYRIHRPAAP